MLRDFLKKEEVARQIDKKIESKTLTTAIALLDDGAALLELGLIANELSVWREFYKTSQGNDNLI